MIESHYTLTPVASAIVFSETDARFDCRECNHSELFAGERYFDMYGIRANDHYRGACPAVRIV